MNDLSLKIALAKELPELIEVHDIDTAGLHTYFIYWLDTGKEVTEREFAMMIEIKEKCGVLRLIGIL